MERENLEPESPSPKREFIVRSCAILIHGSAVLAEEAGLNVEVDKLVYVHENFYRHRGVDSHEIGFYFLVDLSSEFPAPDGEGYIPHREPHLRMRLIPLDDLRRVPLRPTPPLSPPPLHSPR